MHTQIAIVGAGPAGLMLAHLLHQAGIDSVVLEVRSREYVEHRVRAGVLEQGTVDLLTRSGVGERLEREGLPHGGIRLRFEGEDHRIPMSDLTGRAITVYGQQEVVKDLIAARLAYGGSLLFGVEDVTLHDADSPRPVIRFKDGTGEQELTCDFVAGCDGSHGVSRESVPDGVLSSYVRDYPFGWLGILAEVAPSTEELVYCHSPRGFALHSMRSPRVSRLYLQVDPDEDIAAWSDERIWDELRARFATRDGTWTLRDGPVLEKGITAMHSLVVEPMRYGRLFLAGDAAHIVPPTGAKGMNLAIADVHVLARALAAHYRHGDDTGLDGYSATCLERVWRAQHFSWWMTSMLHRFPDDDAYGLRLQLSQLRYLARSPAYATSLAENYVGLPLP